MKSNVIKRVLDPHPSLISQDSILLVFRVLVSLAMINTHGIKFEVL